jgi:hypothetical protein
MNFLRLAEAAGWRTVFLGPAAPVEDVIAAAQRERADLVGVSYRLTPETGAHLLGTFAEAADELRAAGVRFVFGGTPPLAEQARALGQCYGVSVRGMDSIIQMACIIHKTDYWRRGRTPQKLGLDKLCVSELTHYVKRACATDAPDM